VTDLMHTGEAVPTVREDVRMKDVILEMTRKRLGMTTVVDAAGRLVGIITDGDLRRLHLGGEPIAEFAAGQVATRGAKLIGAEEFAAKALAVMETFAITSLVIVDRDQRPIGVIHLHDILRAKIDI